MFDKSPSPQQGDAQTANVEAKPVVANVDGQDTEESSERSFTSAQTEAIVKDRLAREQKKFAKEKAELERQLGEFKKKAPSANVEDDYKAKLTAHEAEKKSLTEKLTKYRQDSLRGMVERKLNEHGCLDAELVFDALASKGQVKFDDDDNLVVENVTNSLDDLVKDFLAARPHLVKASVGGGLGSRGPKTPNAPADPSQMSLDELGAKLGIPAKSKSFFNR